LPDKPATPETLWYAASTTKAQTAATLAHLIDSGKYPALANGWSTTISSIIHDDFVLQDSWATEHITLDDAISHRMGMAAHDKAYAGLLKGKEARPKDIVRNLRNLPLTTEPRVKYHPQPLFRHNPSFGKQNKKSFTKTHQLHLHKYWPK
jgi:CubicO group peptidase (beta-lactamase class C family)